MAKYFVTTSNTSGNEDGTSWAKAYSSIGRAITGANYAGGSTNGTNVPLAPGDTLWVGNNHSETTTAGFTYSLPGILSSPNYIYVVDETVANPSFASLIGPATNATTPHINNSGGNGLITGSYYGYGLKINNTSTNSLTLSSTVAPFKIVMDGCFYSTAFVSTSNFILGSTSSAIWGEINLSNFGYKITGSNPSVGVSIYCISNLRNFYLDGSMATANFPTNLISTSASIKPQITFERCNFSNIPTAKYILSASSFSTVGGIASILFKDCIIPSGDVILSTTLPFLGCRISVYRSDAATNYKVYRIDDYSYGGKLNVDNTVYRTNGVTDGLNFYSWRLALSSNASQFAPYVSFPLIETNATVGSAVNVTLEGLYVPTTTGQSIPTNAAFWIDAQYCGSTNGVQSLISASVKNYLDTPVNLTATTSTWNAGLTVTPRSTAITQGSYYKYSTGGQVYYCTTGGTTASTEPTVVVDGAAISDGTAVLVAAFRFKQTVVLNNPVPALAADVSVTCRIGIPNSIFFIDPLVVFS